MASSAIKKSKVSEEIDLLLLGKTGNGKSSTGNTILGYKTFKEGSSMNSVTKNVTWDVAKYKDRVLKVVDAPGVIDTLSQSDKIPGDTLAFVTDALSEAVAINPRGYNAFILIVKYGNRFTQEEFDAIELLRNIFGKDFIKNFCILVVTNGDSFERDAQVTGLTFQDWLDEQEGEFDNLLGECRSRAILFDNRTKDVSKKEKQLDDLITILDSLESRGRRYTNALFDEAEQSRKRMLVESRIPLVEDKTTAETRLMLLDLEAVEKLPQEEQAFELNVLLEKAQMISANIREQDKGTGALKKILQTIEALESAIATKRRICESVLQERQKSIRDKEALKKQMILQMEEREKKLKSDYQKDIANVVNAIEIIKQQSREERDAFQNKKRRRCLIQ